MAIVDCRLCVYGALGIVCCLSTFTQSAGICEQAKEYVNETKMLLDKALDSDRLNLLLLLDVSGSIGGDLFNSEVAAFAVELINYGIHSRGMKIHPDHAQIEVITFHDTAQVEPREEKARLLHACEIHELFQDILARDSFMGRTEVHVAFNLSSHTFLQNQRVADKKILILVTDAGFTSKPHQVDTSVGILRSMGVEIFTLGVGGLQTLSYTENIQSVVRDDLHFLCYADWKQLLRTGGDTEEEPTTWADVTANQMTSRCPACESHSRCQCAVNLQEYQCRCDAGFYKNRSNICDTCPDQCHEGDFNCMRECKPVEPHFGSLSMELAIALIVLGSSILLTVVIILCVLLLKKKRRREAENKRPFFNFIIMGKFFNIKNFFNSKRQAATHPPRENNPYVISDPSRPPSLNVADFRPVNDIVRRMEENIKNADYADRRINDVTSYIEVEEPRYQRPESRTDTEGYLRPLSHGYEAIQESSSASTCSAYENITHRADKWNSYIKRLVEITPLTAIALFSTEDESTASTENFNIRPSDVAHAQRLIGTETQRTPASENQNHLLETDGEPEKSFLPINGRVFKTQRLEKNCVFGEEMDNGKEKKAIWLLRTDRYIVFGMGTKKEDSLCQKALSDLCSEIRHNDSPPN